MPPKKSIHQIRAEILHFLADGPGRNLGEIASQVGVKERDHNLRNALHVLVATAKIERPSDKVYRLVEPIPVVPIPVVQPKTIPDEVPDDLTDERIYSIIKLEDLTLEKIRNTSLDLHLKIKKPDLNLSIDEAIPAQVESLKTEYVELAIEVGCSMMDIHHVAPIFSEEQIRKKLNIMVEEGKLMKFRPQMPVTVKGRGRFGFRYKAPA